MTAQPSDSGAAMLRETAANKLKLYDISEAQIAELEKTGKPRKTAVDGRTTRHVGYEISQRCRKRIEEVFGWTKGAAGQAKVKLRGRARVDAAFTLGLAAYNLIRLPKLIGAAA